MAETGQRLRQLPQDWLVLWAITGQAKRGPNGSMHVPAAHQRDDYGLSQASHRNKSA